MALGQEQADDAERLLVLAETGDVDLVFPALSVFEAVWEVAHRATIRRRINNDLRGEIDRLSRTSSYRPLIDEIDPAMAALRSIEGLEDAELDRVTSRLLATVRCIAAGDAVLDTMFALRMTHELTRPDALILASVISDLSTHPVDEPKWFISRDRRAFSQPAILDMLRNSGCGFLTTFADGVRLVTRRNP